MINETEEYIFEGEEIAPENRWLKRYGIKELEALRKIMLLDDRAMFDFIVSRKSFEEVQASINIHLLNLFSRFAEHVEAIFFEYNSLEGTGEKISDLLDGPQFGYLSLDDRLLLKHAVLLECDAFLTLDLKLTTHSMHLKRVLGIDVLTPSGLWNLIKPKEYV